MKELIKKLLRENLNQKTIAYHVSEHYFNNFDSNKIGSNDLHLKKEKDKYGFFFTKDEWDVDNMVNILKRNNRESFVYTCELSFTNPFTLKDFYKLPDSQFTTTKDGWNIYDQNTELILNEINEQKKDAVYFDDFVVVFNVNQIKIIKIENV